MTLSKLSLSAAALLISGSALAAQSLPEGFYLQGQIGLSQLQGADFSGQIGGSSQSVATDFDDGYGLRFALGKEVVAWSNSNIGTRIELEFAYQNNDADTVNFSGNGPAPEGNVSGDVSSASLFANVLFDFKQSGKFTPFAGFGLGLTRSDLDVVYGPGVVIRGDDTNFAAQAIVGVSYAVNEQTSLVFDARYARAFDVASPRLAPSGALTGVVADDLDSFSLNAGLRFRF